VVGCDIKPPFMEEGGGDAAGATCRSLRMMQRRGSLFAQFKLVLLLQFQVRRRFFCSALCQFALFSGFPDAFAWDDT